MDQSSDLRALLLKIQTQLSDGDRQRLHFLLGDNIPRMLREDPSLGGTLRALESLFDQEIITDQDCAYLIDALTKISCHGAAKRLQDYQKSHLINGEKQTNLESDVEEDKYNIRIFPNSLENFSKFEYKKQDEQIINGPLKTDNLVDRKSFELRSLFQTALTAREIFLLGLLLITMIISSVLIGIGFTTQKNQQPSFTLFYTNLLMNGDGETGPCESGGSVTHPTGWNWHGSVTQVAYDNPIYGTLSPVSPGPSNRGGCYFYGKTDLMTWMWQKINLNLAFRQWIDSETLQFRLSAWLGGWAEQNDHVQTILTFYNETEHQIGHSRFIGPVYSVHRNMTTSLLFRETNGFVPNASRFCIINVTFTRVEQKSNDGSIDLISFELFL